MQQQQRAGLEGDGALGLQAGAELGSVVRLARGEHRRPGVAATRDGELDGLVVAVEQQQEPVVGGFAVGIFDLAAVKGHRQCHARGGPASRRFSFLCRRDGKGPSGPGRPRGPSGSHAGATEGSASGARSRSWRKPAGTSRRSPSRTTTPRCPGSRRCYCRLASARSRRRQGSWAPPQTAGGCRGGCAAACPGAGGPRRRRWALGAAVPRAVVAFPVLVVLAVGVVVLVVVGREVCQGKTVVSSDKIDAGGRGTAVGRINVPAASEPQRQLSERAVGPPPKIPDLVSVPAVPLRPTGRETAELVAGNIPGLRDQLDRCEHRVLVDEAQKGAVGVHFSALTGERRRQVETEAVDVHLGHPIAKRAQYQPQRFGMADVEAVTGARGIEIMTPVALDEPVIRGVVDTFQRQGRAEMVAFCRVVVDDVQDDFEPCGVERLDHRLELGDLATRGAGRAVITVRGEKTMLL